MSRVRGCLMHCEWMTRGEKAGPQVARGHRRRVRTAMGVALVLWSDWEYQARLDSQKTSGWLCYTAGGALAGGTGAG